MLESFYVYWLRYPSHRKKARTDTGQSVVRSDLIVVLSLFKNNLPDFRLSCFPKLYTTNILNLDYIPSAIVFIQLPLDAVFMHTVMGSVRPYILLSLSDQ